MRDSTSTIGWILLSREAVARAEEALDLDEKGVRDEVGFLALHQGFADRFFPGTSVLHTRLRYAVFVPWLIEKVATKSGADLARGLAAAETALAGQLRAGADSDGIIGGRVWPRPAVQPPSMAYWSALRAWGILRPRADGSTPSRIDSLRWISRRRRPHRVRATDDDGAALDIDVTSPFVVLPPKPDGFGVRDSSLDFRLAPIEREFLRRHLLGVRRPGASGRSLLARLAEAGIGAHASDLWVTGIANTADETDRKALLIARQASALAGIGRAVYAALVEVAQATDGCRESTLHREHLDRTVKSQGHDARAIDLRVLHALVPSLPDTLLRVLSETHLWLQTGQSDPQALHEAYSRAEQRRKGLRARLPDNLAGQRRRAEWEPAKHPLAEPLHYRWPNVRQLLKDLHVQ